MNEAANHSLRAAEPARNATVAASAGTGKTWLLVTRMIRLLLAGAEPDRLLAVTFTRKAAAEMVTRLGERLYELARADDIRLDAQLAQMGIDPVDEPERERARGLYERLLFTERPLRITTFHAFCQELLRKFPLEAEVPAGFELIEATGGFEQAAWEALFQEATRAPEGDTAKALDVLFDATGSVDSTRSVLKAFLDRRSDWWAYVEGAQDPVAHAAERLGEALQIDPEADETTLFTDEEIQQLREFAELLARHPTKTNQGHASLLHEAVGPNATPEERLSLAWRVFFTGDNEPRSRKESNTQKDKMGVDGEARFLELHDWFCERLIEIHDRLARPRTLRVSTAWFQAGTALLHHFQGLKAEQRLLDFADLEWKTYELLNGAEHAHWVQYKLDQRIDHFLIDEFQDTNPTQWRLLLPLFEEIAASEAERERSVFLVGDPKQSIYRFRRAEPGLMTSAAEWLTEHLDAGRYPQASSRRSAAAIMEFVNHLFGEGMLHDRLAQVDAFQSHDTHRTDLWGRVEILPLVRSDDDDNGDTEAAGDGLRNPLARPRPVAEDRRHLEEGRMIAARIQALVDAPTAVNEGDAQRPATYDDVMILLRKRTHARAYEQALREAGIPFVGADRGTLLESLEVEDMVKLLTVLTTPEDDLALAQVLRSPLFDARDEHLAVLARAGSGNWYQHLASKGPQQPAHSPLERAARWLARWGQRVGGIPVHDLLDRIFSEGEVMARYETAYPEALRPRVRANLTRFIELALEIDSGRYPSLSRFLTTLDQLRSATHDAPDEGPAPSDQPRVRVMTIHAAKGLEAPLVFLADTASGVGGSGGWRALVQWPPGHAKPETFWLAARKPERDTITATRLEDEEQAEAREEANLLYVAVTRAVHGLFISAAEPSKKPKREPLGWYGQIAGRVGYDYDNEPDPWTRGDAPPTATAPATMSAHEPVEIDPRLSQPLTPPSGYREIAPSRVGLAHRPDDTGADSDEDGRRRGTAIHRLLALITPPDAVDPDTALSQVAAELGIEPDDPELNGWLNEAQAVIAAPVLAPLFDPDATAYKEVPVCYEANGQTVYGVIDRLVVRDNTIEVIDYKTHRTDAPEALAQIAHGYEDQLWLYGEGVKGLWPDRAARCQVLFTFWRELVTTGHQAD